MYLTSDSLSCKAKDFLWCKALIPLLLADSHSIHILSNPHANTCLGLWVSIWERSQKSRSEKRSKVYGGIQMRFTCLGSFSHIRHTLGARLTSFGAQLWLTLSWCWKEKKEGLLHYQFPFQSNNHNVPNGLRIPYTATLLKRVHYCIIQ